MTKYLLAAALMLGLLSAHAKPIDPMTQAVLNAYADILKQDPSDYTTIYQRALQYYQLEMLDEALQDTEHALRITPDSDKEIKAKEYELLGSIYALRKQYPQAVDAIHKSLALLPGDYELNYRLGEFSLLADDINGARAAFTAMQRIQTRSPEAMLGLARADIAQGKLEDAMTKMKYAEEFNSSLWTTQLSIGNLLAQLGLPQQAAMAYIRSIALADGQSMPLQALFDLAATNYSDVKIALEEAIAKSPNSAAMPLLLGNVAFESGHYRDASIALNNVLAHNQGRQPGVYSLLAECLIAQGRAPEAVDYASRSVELNPTPGFISIKARALRADGKPQQALETTHAALSSNPRSVELLLEEAEALLALRNYKDAAETAATILNYDPQNLYAAMLSALAYEKINDAESRPAALYNLVASSEASSTPALIALRGLAQLKSGKTLDGDATLRNLIKTPTADNCYWAAVAYANAGVPDRAAALAKQAGEFGFENLYLLNVAEGPLTLRP